MAMNNNGEEYSVDYRGGKATGEIFFLKSAHVTVFTKNILN